ncbi:MAG: phosphatase PAP2 family protein, partial [Acidobacteria bacterium]|nr:phosphatase PAP2 family protein [Acidobacteriota bacterium]
MSAHRMVLTFVTNQDYRLMRRMNRWRPPRWFRAWMLASTRAGDGWLWYILGLALLVAGGPQRFAAVSSAALAAVTGVAIFVVLKRVSGRKRPCAIEPHCWATLLRPRPSAT